ncbi:MAG: hypothetical protein JWP87_5458 [Labilithrix sp.]|nr:hypothetical protein [Labilithrix sp.]
MESRAKVLGHPLHQILVMFPLGMLGFAVVCDAATVLSPSRIQKRLWSDAARRAIAAGLVGTVVAAPFGLLDYLAIPSGTRAKSIGRKHALGNVIVMGLFASSLLARHGKTSTTGIALAKAGIMLAGVTAWLGTELIDRLGVGVYEPTSFDAESSARHGILEISRPRRNEASL